MDLLGIHHLTAVSAKIRDNHQFYTKTLGMRLVKRSVNQDDVSAYHLFYADAKGAPGTDRRDNPRRFPDHPRHRRQRDDGCRHRLRQACGLPVILDLASRSRRPSRCAGAICHRRAREAWARQSGRAR